MTTNPPEPNSTPALHAVHSGSTGPTIALVHGFTQTHVSWATVEAQLAADHRLVAVDAPGHGGSTDVQADLAAGAGLLGDAGGRAVYVGYSMGGRLVLRLALDRPDLVAGLVLLGATAGIDDPDERAARRKTDEALADRIERHGIVPFVESWLAQPLFADRAVEPADRVARLANAPAGLASSLRLAGTGTMDPPWWDELTTVSAPSLVVAGERDEKFAVLGRRLADGIGDGARFTTIAGAGHAAYLEQPAAFAVLVRGFVATLPHLTPGPG